MLLCASILPHPQQRYVTVNIPRFIVLLSFPKFCSSSCRPTNGCCHCLANRECVHLGLCTQLENNTVYVEVRLIVLLYCTEHLVSFNMTLHWNYVAKEETVLKKGMLESS